MEVSRHAVYSSTNLPRETLGAFNFFFVHPFFLSSRLTPSPTRMRGKGARKENEDGRIEGILIWLLAIC